MKRSIFLTSFLILTSSLNASTNVPASLSSDAQWYASGNPYIIQGKVVVPKGTTLQVGDGVQVIFQGASALEINGVLEVQGSAAAPAVFNMIEGGLQSELFINGGTAHITNAKFLSGVFLAKDAKLTMEGSEVTKGSGVYLQGATTARLKNNKVYGNATGIVLDGPVQATLTFNTLVQNTYGLLLKSFSDIEFVNNSVHDNQVEVINNTPAFKLGGNYWGTEDSKTVQAKIKGSVDLSPMKSLKDILRVYVRTQLPVITKEMSIALVAKERRAAKEEALALKKFQKEQAAGTKNNGASAAESPAPAEPAPAEQASSTAPTEAAPEAPAPMEASAEVEAPASTNKIASVTALPSAPHKLKPLPNLPPDISSSIAAWTPGATQAEASASTPPTANPATSPEVPQPPAAAAAVETVPAAGAQTDNSIPPAPQSDISVPPPDLSTTPPAATAPAVSTTSPAPPDLGNMAPPDIETSATPPSVSTAPETKPASSAESVPQPPDLNEQIPASTSPAVPPPPAASGTDNSIPPPPSASQAAPAAAPPPATSTDNNAAPPAVQPPPAPISTEPTANQQKAVQSLDSISGDIDGMQAPPLDLGPDLSNNPTADELSGVGQPSSKGTGSNSVAPKSQKPAASLNDSGLALPPLKDGDVTPPKDLDLPPTDDLGNVNLDSRNK